MIFQQEKDLFFNANYERRLGADLEKCRFIFVFFLLYVNINKETFSLIRMTLYTVFTLMPAVSLDKSIDFWWTDSET